LVANIPAPAHSRCFTKALLRYCELDTMAMVFIWEYFNEEQKKKKPTSCGRNGTILL